jgi:integrase
MRAPTAVTVREACEAWLAGLERGEIRNRSGDRYKPSAIRSYERVLRLRVCCGPLGVARFTSVRRSDLQDLADALVGEGLNASTVQSTLIPLKSMYRRAVSRGEIDVNPTLGLELPAVRSRRDRIASPREAAALIAAVPDDDRALWATALYAGLRRGELKALRWEDVDLGRNLIHVVRAWDEKDGEIEPKTRHGKRTVPIAIVLREHLVAHRLRCGRAEGRVFGDGGRPFPATPLSKRAKDAWKATGLNPITLHEGRHTAASLMIAAGVNAKALSTYLGHSSIVITLDLYGHLMPGNEDEAAGLLDAYLLRATRAGAS